MDRIPRIVFVEPVGDFRLKVGFDTGEEGVWTADFRHRKGPMVRPMYDPSFVAKASIIPDIGGLHWPNGYDTSAYRIYMDLASSQKLTNPFAAAE